MNKNKVYLIFRTAPLITFILLLQMRYFIFCLILIQQ